MRRTPLVRTLGAALALALLAPMGAATTYLHLTPYEVLEQAEAVLTATVSDVIGEVDDGYVWTLVTLDVNEWLTDDPAAGSSDEGEEPAEPREVVSLRLLGGEADGRRMLVAGSPRFEIGEEVLVALSEEGSAASPIVGFSQGLWSVQQDGVVGEDGSFLALDLAGRLTRADRPGPPSAVLSAVQAALAGEAPEPLDVPEPEEPAPEDQEADEAAEEPPAEEPAEEEPSAEEPPAEGPPAEGPPAEEPPEEGPAEDADAQSEGEEPPEAGPEPDAEEESDPEAEGEARAPEAPTTPAEPVVRTYAVDDSGGPLLLSERLEQAAEAWEALDLGTIELSAEDGADHRFRYGDEALFGPGLLTLSVAEDGEVEVLVRPEDHPALGAALRHELGLLLGLGPTVEGVMAMAIADHSVMPGSAELAELAAIFAYGPQDLDRDGLVGFGDLLRLAANHGRSGLNLPGDLDGDGDVDDDDVELLREAYEFVPPGDEAP